jgi:hypothetical protein
MYSLVLCTSAFPVVYWVLNEKLYKALTFGPRIGTNSVVVAGRSSALKLLISRFVPFLGREASHLRESFTVWGGAAYFSLTIGIDNSFSAGAVTSRDGLRRNDGYIDC